MKISLRKANQIQQRLSAKKTVIEREINGFAYSNHRVGVKITTDVDSWVKHSVQKVKTLWEDHQELTKTIGDIRSKVALANHEAGINELLCKKAELSSTVEISRQLAALSTQTNAEGVKSIQAKYKEDSRMSLQEDFDYLIVSYSELVEPAKESLKSAQAALDVVEEKLAKANLVGSIEITELTQKTIDKFIV